LEEFAITALVNFGALFGVLASMAWKTGFKNGNSWEKKGTSGSGMYEPVDFPH